MRERKSDRERRVGEKDRNIERNREKLETWRERNTERHADKETERGKNDRNQGKERKGKEK